MSHRELVLGAAPNPQLLELAETTSSVFMLLRPWCLSDNSFGSSTLFKPIRTQAYEYAKAVDLSIAAAQSGFNFCEEVISFSELLDSTDEAERQVYLSSMHELAKQGVETAGEAHSSFRDVRITVEKLLKSARSQAKTTTDQEKLDKLEEGIATLERFSACIQLYISWWNQINMNQQAQETRHGMLVFKYNAIRQQGVLATWKVLRKDYVAYTCKIRFIQDEHAELWTAIRKTKDNSGRMSPVTNIEIKLHDLKRNLKLVFHPKLKKC